MKKKMRKQQIINYFKFVAAGILFLVIMAFISGCGSRIREDGSSSGQKKVLSRAEIQRLEDLSVITDVEDHSLYEEEEEMDVEGIITDNSEENSHCTYVWGWEISHGEEEFMDPQILAQVSEDQKVLQTFSEDEIWLHPEEDTIIEFQGVTDRELVFCSNTYGDGEDAYIWYRIPLSYENGQEKVLCDRKEIIYEEKDMRSCLYCGVGKYLLFGDEKGCFVLDQESGDKKRVIKDSGEMSYGYSGIDPWVSPEGDGYVVLDRYQNGLADALYAYRMGSQEVQEITEGITSEGRIACGDGKLFFTGMLDSQKQNDYNVYVYDMITGRKKVLASEEEIREILTEKPSEHADFIREMAYAQGTLYLEIRYADQCQVISCTVEGGSLAVLEGLSELVRHREYQIPEPIKNGNGKYYNVNDHNIFEQGEDGVIERTLEGAYVRTIRLPYNFVYANNQELIYEFTPDPCGGSIVYSVPLIRLDGNDYPDVNHRKILLKKTGPEYDGGRVFGGYFYADEKYLVYITSDHDFVVYDRRAQRFMDISGLPQERQGFLAGNVLSNMSGEYVFFNSKSESRKTDTFGFSLYHFGDSRVTRIDPRCYTSAAAYWCEDGKTIVYESHSDRGDEMLEICSYDIDTGTRTVLFTMEDLLASFRQASENQDTESYFETFFASDKIYYVAEAREGTECWVVSYDLAGGGELQYEARISDFINADRELELYAVDVAEGKLFIEKARAGKEGEAVTGSEKYYYYDLETGRQAELGEKDGLYLSLVDLAD